MHLVGKAHATVYCNGNLSLPRPAGDGWDGGGFVDLGKIKFV